MSRILILYGTSNGHTERIATVMANAIIASGLTADVIKAGTLDPSFAMYDGVIVAASVRAGKFQQPVIDCVNAHVTEIQAKPNAFVPVCLAVMHKDRPDAAAELAKVLQRFKAATGWMPGTVKWVAGDLPYTRYNFFIRALMKWIVGRSGGDTDTSRDYVYTDWEDVKTFATEFGRRLKAAAA